MPHPPADRLFEAVMIGADHDPYGAPLFRTSFHLDSGHGPVSTGTLWATAFGVYEARLNGSAVADDVLSPGWSSYEWRLRRRSYDVTGRLAEENVLGFAVGNGWYRGRLGFLGGRALYGEELGVWAELEIVFADGHRQRVGTDTSWKTSPSSTLANDLYDGQTIDARSEQTGWSSPRFDDRFWGGVHEVAFDQLRLTPAVSAPVVRHETVRAVRRWTAPSGRTLIDFGQNIVGWLRCTVQGPSGHTITVRHAEVLEHEELGIRPLRTAEATDRFILSGGLDVFEPTFTFHGFRYAEIDHWPGEWTADAVEAVVVHTRLRPTGTFACSDDRLNQLHRNIVWSLRDNFLALPTDCPQRDERLGWTGDIAVFTPTAAYLFDVADFLQDWLFDLAAEQRAGGYVPIVVPDCLKLEDKAFAAGLELSPATAIWGDAAVWVPWALWQAYGDAAVLNRQFTSMTDHVRSVLPLLSANGVWDHGAQFGDWLDPDAPPDDPAASKADPGVVATASLYRSANTVVAAARVLHRTDEVAEFTAIAERLRAAFGAAYVHPDGTITSDCATVYALAIAFGLLDAPQATAAGHRLAQIVADAGYHVSTGFAGTPYVVGALADTGHLDDAYRLLLQTSCPSWLYPVTMGATTIWERWDSMLPDGSINPGEMTSFNHYALGAIADWMHRAIGGISPTEPGYAGVRIAPQPGGGLSWAEASLESPHGTIRTRWELHDGTMELQVQLPEALPAEVVLPGRDPVRLLGGTHTITNELSVAPMPPVLTHEGRN